MALPAYCVARVASAVLVQLLRRPSAAALSSTIWPCRQSINFQLFKIQRRTVSRISSYAVRGGRPRLPRSPFVGARGRTPTTTLIRRKTGPIRRSSTLIRRSAVFGRVMRPTRQSASHRIPFASHCNATTSEKDSCLTMRLARLLYYTFARVERVPFSVGSNLHPAGSGARNEKGQDAAGLGGGRNKA